MASKLQTSNIDIDIDIDTDTNISIIPFVSFIYGDINIPVLLTTMKKFEVIKNMIDDLDSSEIPQIPIINNSYGEPIYFTKEELQHFINLFEISNNIDKTDEDVFEEINQYINQNNISFNPIKKFSILINFLDNHKFLNILCKYIGILIRNGKVKL
jgi:hypothetical protein